MITLINGCSNTVGDDLHPGECWSDLYTEASPNNVVNIARSGQSNHLICRETIRCLELNSEIQIQVIDIEPRFLERPFTTNFQQLQNDVDTQEIIEKFRY